MGAFAVLVPVQLSVLGLYLPPVFKSVAGPSPPQTIISLPVQTATWLTRAVGALVMLVAVQVSLLQLGFGVGVGEAGVGDETGVEVALGEGVGVGVGGGVGIGLSVGLGVAFGP